MKIKKLIEILKKCNEDSTITFYYLKHNDLYNCKYETIIQDNSKRVEFTIQDSNE